METVVAAACWVGLSWICPVPQKIQDLKTKNPNGTTKVWIKGKEETIANLPNHTILNGRCLAVRGKGEILDDGPPLQNGCPGG